MLKLRVIQAEFGDCFILEHGTPSDPKFILIDGGPNSIYEDHLKPVLQEMSSQGHKLDMMVLSHVDEDHVLGLLDFLEDLQNQRKQDETELIAVDKIWHNSFSQTIGRDITDRFNRIMMGYRSLKPVMFRSTTLNRSIGQGDRLTQAARALSIPINPEFAGGRIIAADNAAYPVNFGDLKLHVVGPTEENLEKLKKEWIDWLMEQERRPLIRDPELAEKAAREADSSVPNLSSIMLFAEEQGRTILFTGDGRGDHLIEGLEQAGLLEADKSLHVDVFKAPHHGSMRNVSQEFFKTVTADTYIISANGKHGNPDFETLQWIVKAAKDKGLSIKLFVTNETESTQKLLSEYNPSDYGYRLIVMEPEAHSVVLEME